MDQRDSTGSLASRYASIWLPLLHVQRFVVAAAALISDEVTSLVIIQLETCLDPMVMGVLSSETTGRLVWKGPSDE
jgi:hypothetical protein